MYSSFSRRNFIKAGASLLLIRGAAPSLSVHTVTGTIPVSQMGTTLIHEHFLVDFIGADKTNAGRWNKDDVVRKVLPYLQEAKKHGVKTMFDCTPAFLGRDVVLQQRLSKESGIRIITNTGYYGAVDNKYLPTWAFTETAEQFAERWISEFNNGIEGTAVRPGFIKISVASGPLSELHQKIVTAAALTHLETGLTICSHTGIAIPALEQITLLQQYKVNPSAFVWTHAQAEPDRSLHIKAAQLGAWISLDGIAWGGFEKYADSIKNLKKAGLLHKVLVSHDAGWYKPDEKEGGSFTGFTGIFEKLVPVLRSKGFDQGDMDQLLVKNPMDAFGIRVRKS
jgi:phosphotriesterase-related protein